MRKAAQALCLVLVLAPLLACGKKRAIDPAVPLPPASSPRADPDPAPPAAPEPEPDPVPDPVPLAEPDDYLAQADRAYLEQRYDDAIERYRRHLENPFSALPDHARFRLGLLMAWKGKYQEAIQQFEAVRPEQVAPEIQTQVALLIALLKKATQDADEMRSLKQTLNEIMKKLDS